MQGSDSSLDDCAYHLVCPCCTLCQVCPPLNCQCHLFLNWQNKVFWKFITMQCIIITHPYIVNLNRSPEHWRWTMFTMASGMAEEILYVSVTSPMILKRSQSWPRLSLCQPSPLSSSPCKRPRIAILIYDDIYLPELLLLKHAMRASRRRGTWMQFHLDRARQD